MKTIQYFKKSVYGNDFEYVVIHADATQIRNLTGKKTINESIRKSLTALTGVSWEQVIPPAGA